MKRLLTKAELAAEQQEKIRSKQTRIDTTRLGVIYARQSTKEQPVRNKEAHLMQTDELVSYAIDAYQWDENRTLLFVENNFDKWGNTLATPRAASGRLDKNFRPGLLEVERLITADKVGAVFVRDVSRLFRDESMVNPATFASLCKEHHTVIITYDQEFDFRATAREDLKDFLEEAQAAADYLKTLKRTMQRARERKGARGGYAGGSIPTGFLLDEQRKDFLINPYWAPVVRQITKRFRELDGDVAALHNEILATVPFKTLPEWVDAGQITLRPVEGGYTIAGRKSLIYLLINPANVGHRVYQKRIIKWNAHPAIVDQDDFNFALQQLADVDLQGNPIERPERAKRYTQRGSIPRDGMLSGVRQNGQPVLTSSQGNVFTMKGRANGSQVYAIHNAQQLTNSTLIGSLAIPALDGAVEEVILTILDAHADTTPRHPDITGPGKERLSTLMAAHDAERLTRGRDVLAHLQALSTRITHALGSLSETQAGIEKAIARQLRDYEVAKDEMSDQDIRAHYQTLARLRERLADLAMKQKQQAQIKTDIQTVGEKFMYARKEWGSMDLEQRRAFVRLVTQEIALDMVTGHFARIILHWSPIFSAEQTTHLLLYRRTPSNPAWSDEEDALLREHYTTATWQELSVLLPRRSCAGMNRHASTLGLSRAIRDTGWQNQLSVEDGFLMKRHGISEEQVQAGQKVFYILPDPAIDAVLQQKAGKKWAVVAPTNDDLLGGNMPKSDQGDVLLKGYVVYAPDKEPAAEVPALIDEIAAMRRGLTFLFAA